VSALYVCWEFAASDAIDDYVVVRVATIAGSADGPN